MNKYRGYLFTVLIATYITVPTCLGQVPASQGVGQLDSDMLTPTITSAIGKQDVSALTTISAHLKAVGTTPWTGMQGTGQITYGSTNKASYAATLTILGINGFRLDSQTADGPTSIRIYNKQGKIQDAKGQVMFLPPQTAASGIVQFELPRMAKFPSSTASLLDHGAASVEGVSLQHLTVANFTTDTKTKTNKSFATDLYFDPVSHLLVKSINSIQLNGAGSPLVRVITYGDYRLVGNSMIPFRFTQTLDGQLQWTLQLNEVQLNPALNASFFQF